MLETTDVMPALLQDAPALAAALAGMKGVDMKRESIDKNAITRLFIGRYVNSSFELRLYRQNFQFE